MAQEGPIENKMGTLPVFILWEGPANLVADNPCVSFSLIALYTCLGFTLSLSYFCSSILFLLLFLFFFASLTYPCLISFILSSLAFSFSLSFLHIFPNLHAVHSFLRLSVSSSPISSSPCISPFIRLSVYRSISPSFHFPVSCLSVSPSPYLHLPVRCRRRRQSKRRDVLFRKEDDGRDVLPSQPITSQTEASASTGPVCQQNGRP